MERYHISGVPIIEENGTLVGIITNRDIRFETDTTKRIDEVMTKENLVTGTRETTMDEALEIMKQHKIENYH